jgi:hypothetical protein
MNEITSNQLDNFLKENPTSNLTTNQNPTQIIKEGGNFLDSINNFLNMVNKLMDNPVFQQKMNDKFGIQNQQPSPPPLITEPPKQIQQPKQDNTKTANKVYKFTIDFLEDIVKFKPKATIKELLDDLKDKENDLKEMILGVLR